MVDFKCTLSFSHPLSFHLFFLFSVVEPLCDERLSTSVQVCELDICFSSFLPLTVVDPLKDLIVLYPLYFSFYVSTSLLPKAIYMMIMVAVISPPLLKGRSLWYYTPFSKSSKEDSWIHEKTHKKHMPTHQHSLIAPLFLRWSNDIQCVCDMRRDSNNEWLGYFGSILLWFFMSRSESDGDNGASGISSSIFLSTLSSLFKLRCLRKRRRVSTAFEVGKRERQNTREKKKIRSKFPCPSLECAFVQDFFSFEVHSHSKKMSLLT